MAFALLLGALAALGVAAARPQLRMTVPVSGSAVILALDVSGSMCATDVEPNRLTAAQAAMRTFVKDQDADTRIGLVLFSGFAQVAVAPTTDREPLLRAIDTLTTARGTAIGAAILKSVDGIAEIDPDVAPVDGGPGQRSPGLPGTFAPEIVVLLTDGANTRGVEPVEAARTAADRGVRVYPIGFGTRTPTSLVCTAAQLGGRGVERYGGRVRRWFRRGGRNYLVADEDDAARGGDRDRWRVLRGGRRGPAAERPGGPAAPGGDAVPRRRGERRAGGAGRRAAAARSLWAAARWTAFPT